VEPDPGTMKVDVKRMKSLINRKTCMVGSFKCHQNVRNLIGITDGQSETSLPVRDKSYVVTIGFF